MNIILGFFPFLPNIYLSIIDWLLFCAFIFKWPLFLNREVLS